MKRIHVKSWVGLALAGCLLTSAVYLLSNSRPAASDAPSAEDSNQRLPTDVASGLRSGKAGTSTPKLVVPAQPSTSSDSASGPAPTPPTSKSAAQINRNLSETWLKSVATYHEDDRAKNLDALEDALAQRGPGVVFELKRELEHLTPYQTTERAATFHALGRVGQNLLGSDDPDAAVALAAIQSVAKDELARPAYLPPDAVLHTETMAPAELHAALHLGVVVEKDGKIVQPSIVSKVAAIQMLTAVGDPDALKQLQALQQQPHNPAGIQFALDRAIALVSHK